METFSLAQNASNLKVQNDRYSLIVTPSVEGEGRYDSNTVSVTPKYRVSLIYFLCHLRYLLTIKIIFRRDVSKRPRNLLSKTE